jgi:hypothetical protein
MHVERDRRVTSWRVFWVPQDAVRSGVRRRLLAGWEVASTDVVYEFPLVTGVSSWS